MILGGYLLYTCLPLAFTEEKVSDACHGRFTRQTNNVLTCVSPSTICISEVRFYQWHYADSADGCFRETLAPVPKHCCEHRNNRCYRNMDDDGVKELQQYCNSFVVGTNCTLGAGHSQQVNQSCNTTVEDTRSSVRSVVYTCEVLSSSSDNSTAPTTEAMTGAVGCESPIDAGVVAGWLAGGVAVITIWIILCIVYKRRRKRTAADQSQEKSTANRMGSYENTRANNHPVYENIENRAAADGNSFDYENTKQADYVTIVEDEGGLGHALDYSTPQNQTDSDYLPPMETSNSTCVDATMYEHVTQNGEFGIVNSNYETLKT